MELLQTGGNGDAHRTIINNNTNEVKAQLFPVPVPPAYTGLDFAPVGQFTEVGAKVNPNLESKVSSSNKVGLVTIRMDNVYGANTVGMMDKMLAICDKYKIKIMMCENIYKGIIEAAELYRLTDYRKAQRGGHEIADHSPEHNTDYFRIPVGYESIFTPYIGNGITEIIAKSVAPDLSRPYDIAILERIHLKELSTKKIGTTNGYSIAIGTDKITGDFSSLTGLGNYLYIDNLTGTKIGWVPVKTIASGEAHVKTVDGRTISFTANETLSMYAQPMGVTEVILTENATYLIFLAGQCWFHSVGLIVPTSWIHPGSYSAYILDDYAELAMKRLGISFCDTYGDDIQKLTYNHERNHKYSGHTWSTPGTAGEIELDTKFAEGDITATKNYIANQIALHKHIACATHFFYENMPGSTVVAKIENWLTWWETLLKWCFANNVVFVTYKDLRYCLIDAKTNPFINIIPNLYTDIAVQSKPDGYTLGAGASWINNDGTAEDRNYSLKRTGNGEIFTLTELGGLEKGLNDFNIRIKGTVGATVTVQFGEIGSSVFTIANSGWNRLNISQATGLSSLIIPYTTNFLTITATAGNNTGNDIQVSGMEMRKK